MIRPDGYVKVLDFGLVKLVEQKTQSMLGLEEPTVRELDGQRRDCGNC
jgi:hypothetical protein